MSVYKDDKNGTWYVMVRYDNWKGERKQKCKRGFSTKKDAQMWERSFLLQTSAEMEMMFEDFVEIYTRDIVVQGNPRVYKQLKINLEIVLSELKRIENGAKIDAELLETIRLINTTLYGLKGECE